MSRKAKQKRILLMDTVIEALKKRADDYITQPFRLDELSARIKDLDK